MLVLLITNGVVTRYGNAETTKVVVDVVLGSAVGTHGVGIDTRGVSPPSASTGSNTCGYATVVDMDSP